MKIRPIEKFIGALVVLAAAGYVAYHYWVAPPLIVYELNPIDGSGVMKFGNAIGPITPGGVNGGWGWTLSFTSYTPGVGWSVQVIKNGQIGKTIQVSGIGTIKIA